MGGTDAKRYGKEIDGIIHGCPYFIDKSTGCDEYLRGSCGWRKLYDRDGGRGINRFTDSGSDRGSG